MRDGNERNEVARFPLLYCVPALVFVTLYGAQNLVLGASAGAEIDV